MNQLPKGLALTGDLSYVENVVKRRHDAVECAVGDIADRTRQHLSKFCFLVGVVSVLGLFFFSVDATRAGGKWGFWGYLSVVLTVASIVLCAAFATKDRTASWREEKRRELADEPRDNRLAAAFLIKRAADAWQKAFQHYQNVYGVVLGVLADGDAVQADSFFAMLSEGAAVINRAASFFALREKSELFPDPAGDELGYLSHSDRLRCFIAAAEDKATARALINAVAHAPIAAVPVMA